MQNLIGFLLVLCEIDKLISLRALHAKADNSWELVLELPEAKEPTIRRFHTEIEK